MAHSIHMSNASWDSSELLASNPALRETLKDLAGNDSIMPYGTEKDSKVSRLEF